MLQCEREQKLTKTKEARRQRFYVFEQERIFAANRGTNFEGLVRIVHDGWCK